MRQVNLISTSKSTGQENVLETTIYETDEFPFDALNDIEIIQGRKREYYDVVATFDIETTNVKEELHWCFDKNWAFMYVWQFCINGIVVMGRTWTQFLEFLEKLRNRLGKAYLVIYVHNLQFEFQFMRNYFTFSDVFCKKRRHVIKASTNWIEFRCSYAMTNMSLDKFLQKTRGVRWFKQAGKFDYSVIRFPDTPLSEDEILYCICDVLGLWEAIISKLNEGYTLGNIPITSTGFVREDYRNKCLDNKEHMNRFRKGRLNGEQYILLDESSRGGIAGSNALNTGITLVNIDSEDIKSSYPYQMATKYFPQGKFSFVNVDYGNSNFCDYWHNYCCIISWSCSNIRLKQWDSIPYISKSKTSYLKKGRVGNGKVYCAEEIGMVCTEIDYRIICEHYTFDNPSINKMMIAERGQLSKAFREHLMEMFQFKTDLEDGDRYDYDKYKNKINASFGMLLTDILQPEIIYNPNSEKVFLLEEIKDMNEGLKKYYNNARNFLSYQDGVWVLAHGRDDLLRGMDIVGSDCVQVDTDSVKHRGIYREEFDALNQEIMSRAENFDVKPYAVKGTKKVYLGVWEHEGKDNNEYTYKRFKTLGAKKYCYEDQEGVFHITVSGIRKDKGAEYLLQQPDVFGAFANGTIVPEGWSGRTVAYYNDLKAPEVHCIQGHWVEVGSNICLLETSYTFGITDEWAEMINGESDWEFEEDNCGV